MTDLRDLAFVAALLRDDPVAVAREYQSKTRSMYEGPKYLRAAAVRAAKDPGADVYARRAGPRHIAP